MSLTKVHTDLIKGDIGADGSPSKGQVVQVQTYHVADLAGMLETTSDAFQESGCKVTITPQFSDSLIVCDFIAPMSKIDATSATVLHTRLLLNNVEYGGEFATGYMGRSDTNLPSHQPTVFKTVHSNLAVGTPVEFNLHFRTATSGQLVQLAYIYSSITMTLTEIAQ